MSNQFSNKLIKFIIVKFIIGFVGATVALAGIAFILTVFLIGQLNLETMFFALLGILFIFIGFKIIDKGEQVREK